jgi:hypothetical protein
MWLTHDRGKPVFLPSNAPPPDPREPWIGWHTLRGDHPDYWRPQQWAAYVDYLPPPSWVDDGYSQPVRMWSATQRFTATDAAEIAGEMENERERARGGGYDAVPDPSDPQWWQDAWKVRRSPLGQPLSEHEVEGRVMRALATERCVRVERPACATFAGILARLSATLPLAPGELAAQDPQPMRVAPTGPDHDDMLTALGWLCSAWPATSIQHQVIRLRALDPPLGWRSIARRLKTPHGTAPSHETARRAFRRGIARVCEVANGRLPAQTASAAIDRHYAARRIQGD